MVARDADATHGANASVEQGRDPVRVWALTGHRTGDNAQVRALADALSRELGWHSTEIPLAWKRRLGWTPLYGRMGASLSPLTDEARSRISPPWPDIVVSVGWRSAPVARWIKRQSGARIVQIGRPRAPLDSIDLILTTPQYSLPSGPNVLHLDFPVTQQSPESLEQAAEHWRQEFADLPRPLIAVLVGGNAPPLRLTLEAAAELGQRANALAEARGGSLLIATSPRTGAEAAAAILAQITVPAHSFIWGQGAENPYRGYLGHADEVVVTTDSISMMHDAVLTGKPVHLFDLPVRGAWVMRLLQGLDRALKNRPFYRYLIREGWIYAPRSPGVFRDRLVHQGQAVPLGDSSPRQSVGKVTTDMDRVIDAVGHLLDAGVEQPDLPAR